MWSLPRGRRRAERTDLETDNGPKEAGAAVEALRPLPDLGIGGGGDLVQERRAG